MKDLYAPGNEIEWLDHVAKSSPHTAIGIAEANIALPWAREWISDNMGHTWLQKSPVAKAAHLNVIKSLQDFDAAQAAFEKANNLAPGRGINKFMDTDDGRTAYRKYARAREEVLHAGALPSVAIEQPQSVDKSAPTIGAFPRLEVGLTAFAKRAGITNVWTEGLEKYRTTDEGAALYDAYEDERNSNDA